MDTTLSYTNKCIVINCFKLIYLHQMIHEFTYFLINFVSENFIIGDTYLVICVINNEKKVGMHIFCKF